MHLWTNYSVKGDVSHFFPGRSVVPESWRTGERRSHVKKPADRWPGGSTRRPSATARTPWWSWRPTTRRPPHPPPLLLLLLLELPPRQEPHPLFLLPGCFAAASCFTESPPSCSWWAVGAHLHQSLSFVVTWALQLGVLQCIVAPWRAQEIKLLW